MVKEKIDLKKMAGFYHTIYFLQQLANQITSGTVIL